MAPSAKFTHASIVEGSVPSNELIPPPPKPSNHTDGHDPRDVMPSLSDPVKVIEFLARAIKGKLFAPGQDNTWTWVTIAAVILLTLCGLATVIGVAAYFIWQYFKYSSSTTPP